MKNKIINSIFDIIMNSKNNGVIGLKAEDSFFDGRSIKLGGVSMVNFGLCSYLGLEVNEKVKKGAIDAVLNYGIAFPCSRSYVSSPLFKELEFLCKEIFDCEVVIASNTTLAHQAAIPVVVGDNDIVIIDQMAHTSLQHVASKVQVSGVPLVVLRHNDMSELENKIIEYSGKYDKIWYLSDSIYSMYGDVASLEKIKKLLVKYKKFHFYVDDAHGMSWVGKYGSGYVLDKIGICEKMIVAVSFGKAFGTGGAAILFKDKVMAELVRGTGGPLIFSSPSQMPILGASIASAKIHLSKELADLQRKLRENIEYCQKLLGDKKLPIVSSPETPIFFMALGLKEVAYHFVKKIMDDGYYINLAIFPAVPLMSTGARFTISVNHTKDDIKGLVNSLNNHFMESLRKENRTFKDIQRGFRKIKKFENFDEEEKVERSDLSFFECNNIKDIDQCIWDKYIGEEEALNYKSLEVLQKVYSDNGKREENWDFYYFIVKDKYDEVILTTFFTKAFIKDDMMEPVVVSEKIEKERSNNPYYLCSETLMMGAPCTEGNHLWINYESLQWKEALAVFIDRILEIYNKEELGSIYFKDFSDQNKKIIEFMTNMGFQKIFLPAKSILELNCDNEEQYLKSLKPKYKREIKKDVIENESMFTVEINREYSDDDITRLYELYKELKHNNLEINTFDYPKDYLATMVYDNKFDVLELYYSKNKLNKTLAGVSFNYNHSSGGYSVFILGLNRSLNLSCNLFEQMVYQNIKYACSRGIQKMIFDVSMGGVSMNMFGASTSNRIGFAVVHENINYDIIAAIGNIKETVKVKK